MIMIMMRRMRRWMMLMRTRQHLDTGVVDVGAVLAGPGDPGRRIAR